MKRILSSIYTARYLAKKINNLFKDYIGEICVFWNTKNHYYGHFCPCEEGTIGLVRELEANASFDEGVIVTLKTDNSEMVCNIDNFFIGKAADMICWKKKPTFKCNKNGKFKDRVIDPISGIFDIDDFEDYCFHEDIVNFLSSLIKKHFEGEMCLVLDEECLDEYDEKYLGGDDYLFIDDDEEEEDDEYEDEDEDEEYEDDEEVDEEYEDDDKESGKEDNTSDEDDEEYDEEDSDDIIIAGDDIIDHIYVCETDDAEYRISLTVEVMGINYKNLRIISLED